MGCGSFLSKRLHVLNMFRICCALKVTTYHGARNINDLQEFVQRTKSDQDKLEKMAADEFVPDQATEEEEKVSFRNVLNSLDLCYSH